jgi:subtilisin family serine protease
MKKDMSKFKTRTLGTYVLRLLDDTIPPMDVGSLVSNNTLVAAEADAKDLFQYAMRIHENTEITFPLEMPGGASLIDEGGNWGVGELGLAAARFWNNDITGKGVRIGIADSGIDARLRTFNQVKNQPLTFASFNRDGTKTTQKDQSGNILPDTEAVPTFSHWHGTFCSAVLVGQNDGSDRGLAPDAELVVAQVLHQGNVGTVASILAGLSWIAEQHCDIVSLSLGWPGRHDEWAEPIQTMLRRGTVIVAAIGNEHGVPGVEDSRSPANYPISPTSETDGILISVGAHDSNGFVADFSGGGTIDWSSVTHPTPFGESSPSVFADAPPISSPLMVAPGVDIIEPITSTKYQSSSGSSMATPHVAGLLALILSLLRKNQADSTPRQAADLLLSCLQQRDGAPSDREGSGHCSTEKIWEVLGI